MATYLSNDRIICWRLLLEEFGPEYEHIAGKDNIVADALSRLELDDGSKDPKVEGQVMAHLMCTLIRDESIFVPEASDVLGMAECFAYGTSATHEERFPMSPKLIAKEQLKDRTFKKKQEKHPTRYSKNHYGRY
jgi:hypothetical protein